MTIVATGNTRAACHHADKLHHASAKSFSSLPRRRSTLILQRLPYLPPASMNRSEPRDQHIHLHVIVNYHPNHATRSRCSTLPSDQTDWL